MEANYLCPECEGQLRIGSNVIFSAKTKRGYLGLILLEPTLGDYRVSKHPTFKFEKDERINFYCPLCHARLGGTGEGENLARILMTDEKNNRYEILFSEIYGEKCTYKIKETKVEAFGEHASRYEKYVHYMTQK